MFNHFSACNRMWARAWEYQGNHSTNICMNRSLLIPKATARLCLAGSNQSLKLHTLLILFWQLPCYLKTVLIKCCMMDFFFLIYLYNIFPSLEDFFLFVWLLTERIIFQNGVERYLPWRQPNRFKIVELLEKNLWW